MILNLTKLEFATCLIFLNSLIIFFVIFHQMIKNKNNKDIKKIKSQLIEIETIALNIMKTYCEFSKDINNDTYSLKRNVEDIEKKIRSKYNENDYMRGEKNNNEDDIV